MTPSEYMDALRVELGDSEKSSTGEAGPVPAHAPAYAPAPSPETTTDTPISTTVLERLRDVGAFTWTLLLIFSWILWLYVTSLNFSDRTLPLMLHLVTAHQLRVFAMVWHAYVMYLICSQELSKNLKACRETFAKPEGWFDRVGLFANIGSACIYLTGSCLYVAVACQVVVSVAFGSELGWAERFVLIPKPLQKA